MRKFILTAISALAITGAVAGTASANVAVDNGVGHADKGDVQMAFKWNNGDFDKYQSSLKFTANYTATYDNVLTCGANADNKVVRVPVEVGSGSDLNVATLKSDNGKQITGWDLKGAANSVAGSNDLNKVMQAMFTACLPDKPIEQMTAEELRRLPVSVVTPSQPTVTFGGLKVTATVDSKEITKDLPNTPVEVAPVVPAA
jgi:hypothetical protein